MYTCTSACTIQLYLELESTLYMYLHVGTGTVLVSKMYQYQILQVLYMTCARTTTYRLLAGLRPMCDFSANSGLSL